MKGEEPDLSRAAALLIDDFRSGRLGRMTLERR
jgi:ribosome biogenesis GTPase A